MSRTLRIMSGKSNFAVCHDDDSSYQRLRSVKCTRRKASATAAAAARPQSHRSCRSRVVGVIVRGPSSLRESWRRVWAPIHQTPIPRAVTPDRPASRSHHDARCGSGGLAVGEAGERLGADREVRPQDVEGRPRAVDQRHQPDGVEVAGAELVLARTSRKASLSFGATR